MGKYDKERVKVREWEKEREWTKNRREKNKWKKMNKKFHEEKSENRVKIRFFLYYQIYTVKQKSLLK